MANSICVLITRSPYGLEEAFAGLRLALAFGVNGMKATIVMIEDGVYNAVKEQKPEVLKMPSNIDAINDTFEFESQAFVVREDLAARGIAEDRIIEGIKLIDASEIKSILETHDVITTF